MSEDNPLSHTLCITKILSFRAYFLLFNIYTILAWLIIWLPILQRVKAAANDLGTTIWRRHPGNSKKNGQSPGLKLQFHCRNSPSAGCSGDFPLPFGSLVILYVTFVLFEMFCYIYVLYHNRGWDGWMASPTQWTWVWANSGRWWKTGKSGMLQSMGSQRVGHHWATRYQSDNWGRRLKNYEKKKSTQYWSVWEMVI